MKSITRCSRCVMDNSSDTTITFDENGYCNYCTEALAKINTTDYFPNEDGKQKLERMLQRIKENGKGKEYDCLMGLSGGLDSSYLAYLGYTWGLRILAVHIDDGFDTDISKENLKKLCNKAHIELKVINPDAEQFKNLTLAYMRAGVPNLAVPQDNILFAYIYDYVVKSKVKYFLTGGNFALESILQNTHVYNAMDVVNIKDINRKYGNDKINKLKFISSYKKYFYLKTGKAITLRPLNYIDYNRDRAFKELKEFCGFEYYGSKHLENILTAFVQLYWYPKKFGVDKRTSHLSSMIVSGQMSRDEALKILEMPAYDENLMREYISIIKKKFDLSDEVFDELMNSVNHSHYDFKTDVFATKYRKFFH